MRRTSLHLLWIGCIGMLPSACIGQVLYGVGITAGTLGAGIQGAVSVTKSSNLRAGFNDFSYSDTFTNFTKDGIHYGGTLSLRSAQVTYDQYIPHMGGFHISPGALIYDANSGTANASVPAGQQFSLGNASYYSSAANPVTGSGTIAFTKAAPMLLLGFGNMLPRSAKHFSIGLEGGVVFEGSPNAKLNLAGSACAVSATAGCVNAATDPTVQANVQAEQTKLNNNLNPFKYYPVISIGFSYKFGR